MTAILTTLLLSVFLCGAYLWFARARGLLDTPDARSSHSRPTPHGGGAALMLAFVLGLLLASWLNGVWEMSYIKLTLAALILTVVGVSDDLWNLSVALRLFAYGVVCLFISATLLNEVAAENDFLAVALALVAALAMVWALNLYNFMDGIDGIAALQAIFACSSAALLSWLAGGDASYACYCLLLAAAHGGFLVWNFPPARLFMGDAGSVSTGFLLAGLALLGAVRGELNPWCWLVLLAVFITDTGWTLLWRMATGQAFTRPHRLHAYQRLSRHWRSHLRVDALVMLINALWLLPIAVVIQIRPEYSFFLVFLAYLPLLCGMAKIQRLT